MSLDLPTAGELAEWLSNPWLYVCGGCVVAGFLLHIAWDWWQGTHRKPPPDFRTGIGPGPGG